MFGILRGLFEAPQVLTDGCNQTMSTSSDFKIMKEISSELRQLLEDITPNFQENLVRAFKNEGLRPQQRGMCERYIKELDDILISQEDTKIELRNLKFPWIPDFRINSMSVNLGMLCLDVDFKLGDLHVEGDYEGNNLALQKLLPVSNNGKIGILFKNVTAKGRIGLIIEEDSLTVANYDIDYQSQHTVITVKYVAEENEIENSITKSNGEFCLGDPVWTQLVEILTEHLHRQIGAVIVEFSLTELLIDEDEQLREMAREHSLRANKLLDSILCLAKDYLVGKKNREIKTPAFSVTYRGKPSGVEQGRFATDDGYIQDLSTLTRPKDLSLYEDKHQLVVYGSISLREFKHGYESFNSQFENTQITGQIKSTVYRNKIFIKLNVIKEGERCRTQVEAAKVSSIKDIDIDASGLASLSWLVPKLESWVIGNLRYTGLPVLEKYIKEALDYAIANTDCIDHLAD